MRYGPAALLRVAFVRYSIVGILCTAAYLLMYLALRQAMGAHAANFLAMLGGAVLNTAVNRSFTFGRHDRDQLARHHLQGVVLFGLGWCLTAAALAALHRWDPTAASWLQVTVLFTVTLAASLMRFQLLQRMFAVRQAPPSSPSGRDHPASDSAAASDPSPDIPAITASTSD